MEIFKDIEGFEGWYAIGNETTVKSLERTIIRGNGRPIHVKEKIRRPTTNSDGYLQVKLCKNGVEEEKLIHQLVAEAFIENPYGYKHVHHKNHIQTDNRVENLEWISKEEHDRLHADERAKVVYQFEDDEIVNVWRSAYEAARVLGFKQSAICNCCNGERKKHGGFGWSYSPLEQIKKSEDLNLALL